LILKRTLMAFFILPLLTLGFRESAAGAKDREPARFGYRIVNIYPHDTRAFTQGLIFHNNYLYESTGLYGHSQLRKVHLETGRVERIHYLGDKYFGEGLALFKGRLYQLTWQNRIGFIFDLDSFKEIGRFSYKTEGWGLTSDENHLIMSDGSATLRFLDPKTFRVVKELQIFDRGRALYHLNELEFIKGEIYANIWNTENIVRISPATGQVTGWIDLTGLKAACGPDARMDVLNGIAYDERKNRLFVTGKFWPKLFEIELLPLAEAPPPVRR